MIVSLDRGRLCPSSGSGAGKLELNLLLVVMDTKHQRRSEVKLDFIGDALNLLNLHKTLYINDHTSGSR